MLVVSHASSFYGMARSTHDVDLVIDLDSTKILELLSRIDLNRYYLSESALREGRMANLIDLKTGDKVDCFILGLDPNDRLAFSRRRIETILGNDIFVATADDTILAKMRWGEMIGGSNQQQLDITEIFKLQNEILDFEYLQTQASITGLVNILKGTSMIYEKLENQIAMKTEAGREAIEVWYRVQKRLTGVQKVVKSFELTELTRQTMRAGIRKRYPDATETKIQEIYVDRLLSFHGTSVQEIRRKQRNKPPRSSVRHPSATLEEYNVGTAAQPKAISRIRNRSVLCLSPSKRRTRPFLKSLHLAGSQDRRRVNIDDVLNVVRIATRHCNRNRDSMLLKRT